ncbi:MAG: hypothetical protein COV34_01325 [Candidatus Zambryskibacteria bacterium CG10_big_fil_rev_8_21_14_0_10_42_12]|uniref:ABC transporter substrate-binding protein n=1 Tax=Candidatus Zambryskibacteria bacterium CG10_big_fil_rev_8_21_14_0_10_42_12 TaxID=1975115 RepID=A0A2H0QVE9_9BACT|nr:MAG: hypothetical protein COV34_01325 [Candidatus Zambryskibacteria bacterium CG10_big_fil_rev_8_21_14_0_10_42_12]
MNRFQIILIAAFAFFAVFGVFLFATFRGAGENQQISVTMWGTLPQVDFYSWYSSTPLSKNNNITVTYVYKNPDTFDQDFVEALADGRGPDIIFLPHEKILEHGNRIYPIPYDTLSERNFRDLFVEGTEIFLGPNGSYALPIIIDPLVMYWNRDIFRNAGIAQVPQYWDEFPSLALSLVERDSLKNITQSAVALGEYGNVYRARDIISVLLMQAGTPITQQSSLGLQSVLGSTFNFATMPADAALTFYTQFANPAKDIYSWNRSFNNSLNIFASGDLGILFARSSDLFAIQSRNPNLNFDVALLPQPREATNKMTYGYMEGLALVKQSQKLSGAYRVIQELTSKESVTALSNILKLPPVRRDVLVSRPSDAYLSVFYESALISQAWLSPHPATTDSIFRDMVESITSGRLRMGEAIRAASDALNRALGRN